MDGSLKASRLTLIRIGAALVVAGALVIGAAGCGSDSSSDSTATVEKQAGAVEPDAGTPSAGNWQLTWSDEFNGPAGGAPDPAKWGYSPGRDPNGGPTFYTDSAQNASTDGNGNLLITARKEMAPGSSCGSGACKYTSARIWTERKFSQAYGRFEASVQVPSGKGLRSGFWLWRDDSGVRPSVAPTYGEIDVMDIGGNDPSGLFGLLAFPNGRPSQILKRYELPAGQSFSDGFHTFAVEWEPDAVRWYVDDQLYGTVTRADVPAGSRWVYDRPFSMILNLVVGGGAVGSPDSATKFPSEMKVDYVRVYKRPEGATPAN
jgi:beta-glucanase (GH16 family)